MSILYPITRRPGGQVYGLLAFSITALLTCTNLSAQVPNKLSDQSSFKSNLINVEAVANETFRYSTTLHNGTSQAKIYQLNAQLPEGWLVAFKTMGNQVTAVKVEAGSTQEVTVELNPRPDLAPSKYPVLITAVSPPDSLKLSLEAVLKGAYNVELTTPSGRLSDEVTEGSSKEIHLILKNTASLPLENLELTSQAPQNWDITFEPSKINLLDPGKTVDVKAMVKVPSKTIAGDYVTTFSGKNNQANSSASFRMTVKTSALSGWAGMLVIVAAIGLVYNLIRKYGRR